ncbi:phthalate 4,5-dioxygenase, reductase subunit [Tistlia consotensis]|uniref:Phthalate 4,5-dioxygenase, reductase subunit n=1 Tax=Tistlia consotensis USBA 355 TaxID=560819 RepID=A0A1Y6CMZ9_9PROT|nr:PDR/VanB family oxidoreductase [Tistlia consotensis]SMF75527.1 phthalate 4,5-dioxygenase, reductase subunit [Tistlia consotensis USBA 355]SNS07895.1 phthalate 4,5-dioxygenase, reductase subunit [Tistlia consotensis]
MAEETTVAELRPLLVRSKRQLTPDIWQFELVDPDGGELPPFEAGCHVTVETPSGARRTYSLSNDPEERDRYVLGVKQERSGRGGSTSLIEGVQEGDSVPVSLPINRFPLVEAPEYLFVAGGIGITPILSMVRKVAREGEARFRLIYCTRSPELTAFREELQAPELKGRVVIHHDEGDPDRVYDFWVVFEKPGRAQVYCCGPKPLMEEVRGMTGHWPPGAIHFEDFAGDVPAVKPDDRAFTVRNARTGETVEIPADRTILETLRAAGHRLPSSCESGTCGSCRTKLVAGEPDHRDMVLTDEEQAGHIMICVSRARSDELVLEW